MPTCVTKHAHAIGKGFGSAGLQPRVEYGTGFAPAGGTIRVRQFFRPQHLNVRRALLARAGRQAPKLSHATTRRPREFLYTVCQNKQGRDRAYSRKGTTSCRRRGTIYRAPTSVRLRINLADISPAVAQSRTQCDHIREQAPALLQVRQCWGLFPASLSAWQSSS